jgi:hypothetical protein
MAGEPQVFFKLFPSFIQLHLLVYELSIMSNFQVSVTIHILQRMFHKLDAWTTQPIITYFTTVWSSVKFVFAFETADTMRRWLSWYGMTFSTKWLFLEHIIPSIIWIFDQKVANIPTLDAQGSMCGWEQKHLGKMKKLSFNSTWCDSVQRAMVLLSVFIVFLIGSFHPPNKHIISLPFPKRVAFVPSIFFFSLFLIGPHQIN